MVQPVAGRHLCWSCQVLISFRQFLLVTLPPLFLRFPVFFCCDG